MSGKTDAENLAVIDGLIDAAELICRGETDSFDRDVLELPETVNSALLRDIAESLEDAFVHMPGTLFRNKVNLKKWKESDLRWQSEVDLVSLRALKQEVPEESVRSMRDAALAADFRVESDPTRYFIER